jgi:hypothetical protein
MTRSREREGGRDKMYSEEASTGEGEKEDRKRKEKRKKK